MLLCDRAGRSSCSSSSQCPPQYQLLRVLCCVATAAAVVGLALASRPLQQRRRPSSELNFIIKAYLGETMSCCNRTAAGLRARANALDAELCGQRATWPGATLAAVAGHVGGRGEGSSGQGPARRHAVATASAPLDLPLRGRWDARTGTRTRGVAAPRSGAGSACRATGRRRSHTKLS